MFFISFISDWPKQASAFEHHRAPSITLPVSLHVLSYYLLNYHWLCIYFCPEIDKFLDTPFASSTISNFTLPKWKPIPLHHKSSFSLCHCHFRKRHQKSQNSVTPQTSRVVLVIHFFSYPYNQRLLYYQNAIWKQQCSTSLLLPSFKGSISEINHLFLYLSSSKNYLHGN